MKGILVQAAMISLDPVDAGELQHWRSSTDPASLCAERALLPTRRGDPGAVLAVPTACDDPEKFAQRLPCDAELMMEWAHARSDYLWARRCAS